MLGSFISRIADSLEEIDKKAASNTSKQDTQPNPLASQTFETSDAASTSQTQTNSQNVPAPQSPMQSLEQEVLRLREENEQLCSESSSNKRKLVMQASKIKESEKNEADMQLQITSLQGRLNSLTNQLQSFQSDADAEKHRLEKELNLSQSKSSEEQAAMASEIAQLKSALHSKEEEVASLEAEATKFRSQAVEELTKSASSNSVTDQLSILESERERLNEKFNRSQQKISQLELIMKEKESEVSETKAKARESQGALEEQAFKQRTQIEALQHEVEICKSQIVAEKDQCEARVKSALEECSKRYEEDISKLKEQLLIPQKKSNGAELLQAMETIETLKGEKAALMNELEQRSQKSPIDFPVRRHKNVPIVAIIPSWLLPYAYKPVSQIDAASERASKYLAGRPLARILIALWVLWASFSLLFWRK